MKRIQSIFYSAMIAGSMLSIAACNNENAPAIDKQAELKVSVSGISNTRSIITGTSLPDECQFGIFAMGATNGNNAKVNYVKGTCTFDSPVILTSDAEIPVYAYYPYNPNLIGGAGSVDFNIEVDSQTDYLYANGIYVQPTNPEAKIAFKHVMARIIFKIKKAEGNTKNYHLQSASLENVYEDAVFNISEGAILDPSGSASVGYRWSPETTLDSEQTIDWLVLPMDMAERNVALMLGFTEQSAISIFLPKTIWQSGRQYVYTATVRHDMITISEAAVSLEEWNNNDNGDITINN